MSWTTIMFDRGCQLFDDNLKVKLSKLKMTNLRETKVIKLI